jgi:lipase chaperone LimK
VKVSYFLSLSFFFSAFSASAFQAQINGKTPSLFSLCFEGLVGRRAGARVAQDQRPSEHQNKKYGSYYIWPLPHGTSCCG